MAKTAAMVPCRCLVVFLAVLLATVAMAQAPGEYALTRIRFLPAPGERDAMKGGRFAGSNEGPTTEFRDIVRLRDDVPTGQWVEITLPEPVYFRYVKYEGPPNSHGRVAEIEFYNGDRQLRGEPFGTNGSRDDNGNVFGRALDGDVTTYFEGRSHGDEYVGVDFGPASQAAPVEPGVAPGSFEAPQSVTLRSATAGAAIRYVVNGGTPSRAGNGGSTFTGPIAMRASGVIVAFATAPGLADSPVRTFAYRIGGEVDVTLIRSFHIGNSLTDTIEGWLEPVALAAGKNYRFHRFTIPGAPTDWLWNHPGSGFGDARFAEAFFAHAPFAHIATQPFAGHGRSIENEAQHSRNFFDACRAHSPDVQAWLYVQWPSRRMDDSWTKGEGATRGLNLTPATTFQEAVSNHLAYTEAVRDRLQADGYAGKPVRIIPGGVALALLKTEIDAGRVPGMPDFFAATFDDDLHLRAAGRYLVALVHYACLFNENPEGRLGPLNSGLTAEQAVLFQRLAWQAARSVPSSGVR